MNQDIIPVLLSLLVIIEFTIILFLIYTIKKNNKTLKKISNTIHHIVTYNTDEKVMSFSENKCIIGLMESINIILNEHQKVKTNFRKSELSSKRMLSNISHDLKTPLTVILGYLEILLLSNSSEKDTIKKVYEKTTEVINLINKFFTLSKIESGDIQLTLEKINLAELCRKAAIDYYQILTEKNFTVDIQIPEEDIIISGNEDAICRILNNLISNAIRYGHEGKYIGIKLYTDCNTAFIEIKDKGKGIDKKNVSNVFDRLYTLDDSRNPNLGGNGLGLAIAKSLAQKQNGSLELVSIPYKETIFTLKLPLLTY